jgi:hypothetical protein
MLWIMRPLRGDADVTPVALITRLTATARQFSGIVTAWVGKTAREGGS